VSTVKIPATAKEFYLALGRSSSTQAFKEMGVPVPTNIAPGALLKVAEDWCTAYKEELQNLEHVLERAQAEAGYESIRFLDDLTSNFSDVGGSDGIATFFNDPQCQYLSSIVEAGMERKGKELQSFFDFMQKIL